MHYSALIGNPVEHSVSWELFKIFAELAKIEYSHIKIKVENKRLGVAMDSLSELGFSGCNVTLPYKLKVIKYLDRLSPEAKKIGAVNTIVFKGGKRIGYNTDAIGAFMAIEKKLKKISKDDRVLILGAGGAARAIAFECFKKCKNITVLNRSLAEGESLSRDISAGKDKIIVKKLTPKNIAAGIEGNNLIINATSVGMHPDSEDEIVEKKIIDSLGALKNKYFFDAIFNPYKTKFLRNAESKGAKTCSGTYMMIYQALQAFKLWTGIDLGNINIEKVNDRLIKALN